MFEVIEVILELMQVIAMVLVVIAQYYLIKKPSDKVEPEETKPQINDKALKSITDSKGFFSYRKYKNGERGDKS